jgi:hypothetical protein
MGVRMAVVMLMPVPMIVVMIVGMVVAVPMFRLMRVAVLVRVVMVSVVVHHCSSLGI